EAQFHKDWQWPVATWFNQLGQKIRRHKAQASQGGHYGPTPSVQTLRAQGEVSHQRVSWQGLQLGRVASGWHPHGCTDHWDLGGSKLLCGAEAEGTPFQPRPLPRGALSPQQGRQPC
ncbi:unnamed protein product, partial [Gulo gulo]